MEMVEVGLALKNVHVCKSVHVFPGLTCSYLVARSKMSAFVRQLPDYGATVFAPPLAASEGWSPGDPFPFCEIRLESERHLRKNS